MKKVFITILALAVVGLGLYFLLSQKWLGNEYQSYQNSKYNFSLDYPKTWYALGAEADSSVIRFSDTAEESGDGGVPLGAVVDVMVLENYDGLSLENWIEESLNQGPEQEILREEVRGGKNIQFLVKVFNPITGPVEAGPTMVAYAGLENKKYILQINYMGRNPNYKAGMKYFEHLLKSFKVSVAETAGDASAVVSEYMKGTLGMIPGAKIDYDAAKKLLTPDLAEQFENPMFIPASYCMQDGPTDVRISKQAANAAINWTEVTVEARYGDDWAPMWSFQVVPVEGDAWLINEIECLRQ